MSARSPVSPADFSLLLTYRCEAGSSPTSTSAEPGRPAGPRRKRLDVGRQFLPDRLRRRRCRRGAVPPSMRRPHHVRNRHPIEHSSQEIRARARRDRRRASRSRDHRDRAARRLEHRLAHRSSVMPPIATTGKSPGRAFCRRRLAPARGRSARSRSPSCRFRRPVRPPRSRSARAARARPARRCASRVRRSRPARARRATAAGARSSCPTWTPAAPDSRAMSARSFTMTVAPPAARPRDDRRRRVEEVAPPARCFARICSSRAPPSRHAAAKSTRRPPGPGADLCVADDVERRKSKPEVTKCERLDGFGETAAGPPGRGSGP